MKRGLEDVKECSVKRIKSFKSYVRRDNDQAIIKVLLPRDDGCVENKYLSMKYHTTKKTIQMEIVIPITMHKLMDHFFSYVYLGRQEGIDVMKMFDRRSDATKEVLESTAAIWHLQSYLTSKKIDILHRKKLMLDVGGGITPRTASLFFSLDKNLESRYLSVDPLMKSEYAESALHHKLQCFNKTIEEVAIEEHFESVELIVIVAVHCHANIDTLWKRCIVSTKPVILVSMPCCKGFVNLPKNVEEVYHVSDSSIPSACDEVFVYVHGDL